MLGRNAESMAPTFASAGLYALTGAATLFGEFFLYSLIVGPTAR
jgi:hypothetical protein